jgi:hypothetical protein
MSIRNDLLEQIYQATLSGGSTPYYVEATRFTDLTSQPGGAIDTLNPVTIGTGGTDPDGIITADATGVLTINKSGPLMVKQSFQITRSTNQGNAEIFFQAQASTDGGTTWLPLGNAINRRISNDNSISVFFDISPVFLTAGLKVRNVWAKSSVGGDPLDPTVGSDNGLLVTTQASSALVAAGVQQVPSATAVVYKLEGYNYV